MKIIKQGVTSGLKWKVYKIDNFAGICRVIYKIEPNHNKTEKLIPCNYDPGYTYLFLRDIADEFYKQSL